MRRALITTTFLFTSLAIKTGLTQTINHWETIIKAEDTWKYIIPTSQPDAGWLYPTFNDNNWNQDPGGFGYADGDDGTIVPNGTKSVYFRKTFDIADTSELSELILLADYDDAFVAWINGQEVGRGGGLTDAMPTFDQLASYTHEAVMYTNGYPNSYPLTKSTLKNLLHNGTNVLCVQVHNDQVTSSDMTSRIYLMAGIADASVVFQPVLSWFKAPVENDGTSNLPIIHINTNGNWIPDEPKITATLSVFDKGPGNINSLKDSPVLECRIGIETRGSISQQFPKKSYGFETRTALDSNLNVSLLGLPADNDWILYAPYDDKTFLRDILAYRMGTQMGHYAPRYVLCEVYLNAEYIGVYVLLEKIKHGVNRVNIANLKKTDLTGKAVTGGYIFKIDKATGSINDGWTSMYHPVNANNLNINFLYHYPKPEDIAPQQKTYIKAFVDQFETTLASSNFLDPLMGYEKFIDVPSFVDYFLVNEISKNVDGYRISSFFHKDKEDRLNKIVAGPLWDYNLGFGNADYYNGASTEGWIFNNNIGKDYWQVPFWWSRFLKDPKYCQVLKQRYTNFRQNILKTENINAYVDSLATVLDEPQERNYQKWPILGTYIWPNPFFGATYQSEIDYMKDWINRRLLWMDNNLPNLLILDSQQVNPIITDEMAVVFPNPFTTNLYIEIFPDNSGEATIELYNISGRKLFTDKVKTDYTEKTMYSLTEKWESANSLVPGIYILKTKLKSGKEFTTKIVKK